MSVYAKLLEHASKGGRFRINLKRKDLWIGKKQYVKEGVMLDEDDLICKSDFEQFNILVGDVQNMPWKNVVSYLYQMYKHYVPNSNWKDNGYFKALPSECLTMDELAFNMNRNLGQAMLDGYILLGSIKGWLKWENDGHWFWQDDNDLSCIVLKEWV